MDNIHHVVHRRDLDMKHSPLSHGKMRSGHPLSSCLYTLLTETEMKEDASMTMMRVTS